MTQLSHLCVPAQRRARRGSALDANLRASTPSSLADWLPRAAPLRSQTPARPSSASGSLWGGWADGAQWGGTADGSLPPRGASVYRGNRATGLLVPASPPPGRRVPSWHPSRSPCHQPRASLLPPVCLSVSLLLSLSLQLRSHILLTPLWTQDLQGELEEPRAYGRASGRFLARAASPCRQAPNASPPMPFSWPILHPIPSPSPPFTGLLPTGQ